MSQLIAHYLIVSRQENCLLSRTFNTHISVARRPQVI